MARRAPTSFDVDRPPIARDVGLRRWPRPFRRFRAAVIGGNARGELRFTPFTDVGIQQADPTFLQLILAVRFDTLPWAAIVGHSESSGIPQRISIKETMCVCV